MFVRFYTKAYQNISFFESVAYTLLKFMGLSGTIPGALTATELPAALESLQKHLKTERLATGTEEKEDEEPEISLVTRADPLIKLLNAALEEKSSVLWERSKTL